MYYNRPVMRTIYRLLASLKSAIVLMVILSGLSLIGTLIPQGKDIQEYLVQFPRTGHMILALGFDRIYQSLIFQLGMWLLSVSTVVCILTRWKATSRKIYQRVANVSEKEIAAMKFRRKLEKGIKTPLKNATNRKYDNNGCEIILRSSGRLALIGGMFIHIGFLAILAGGLIGLFFSIETVIRGKEGDRVPIASVKAIRAARKSDQIAKTARGIRAVSPNDPRLQVLADEIQQLHEQYHQAIASPEFRIAFDKLWVDHHTDTQGNIKGVRSWNSQVRFIENGQETESTLLKVNSPVSYGDYTFYQANWNQDYGKVQIKVDLREDLVDGWADFQPEGEFPKIIELAPNKPLKLDWAPFSLMLHQFFPDFRIINDRFVSISNELNNPAAQIVAFDDSGNPVGRAIAFVPDRVMSADHVSKLPFLFTFHDALPENESGIQMTYDPGKSLVWLGCIIFSLGLVMSFYIAYKEEWLILYPDCQALVAVAGNRPTDTMEEWLDNLYNQVANDNEQENP